MCGIAGIMNTSGTEHRPDPGLMRGMLGAIRHRGPDQFGIYFDQDIALGSARLSIIDLAGGQQPISNEDQRFWIVFNGEIFNYVELRPELENRGHRFATNTDTEVLVHMYEEYGPRCLDRLNGQFAIAIWDKLERTLFLARDRLGVRPLYYTRAGGRLVFGSEIKALLANSQVKAELDPESIAQIFTFWSTLSPRTAFRGIREIPPGHYLIARDRQMQIQRYWAQSFELAKERALGEDVEELQSLLIDATRIRLRADVPVGAYLSGGLDSSTITALARKHAPNRLETFSIAFNDENFDESAFQRQMASFLGTNHHVANVTHEDIGRVFPDVIWHTETPVMRTSPAPMFLLSRMVREHGLKVVLTGEGADEFLAGYDIFKEAAIRRFWSRHPESKLRPLLLRRLYPDIGRLTGAGPQMLAAFFGQGLTETGSPFYSHAVRWRNNARTLRFFAGDAAVGAQSGGSLSAWRCPDGFQHWGALAQSQFIEIDVFLSQYLLSSQGDRMAMAHSVEGRFPFLDHRVIDFCNHLPARRKLNGSTEKFVLKRLARDLLPEAIWQRTKRPYRAPIHRSFLNPGAQYVRDLLSAPRLKSAGLFNAAAVERLLEKAGRSGGLGETDDMALVGIISTQLLFEQFVAPSRRQPAALLERDDVKVCRGHKVQQDCVAAGGL